MKIQTKALYNLLRFTSLNNPNIKVKPWQIENLRKISLNELFEKLHKLNIYLDQKSFKEYAKNADSPEELLEIIAFEIEDIDHKDQIYLIIFEIFRRLCIEKQCITIFADDLDNEIFLYDNDELTTDENIQDMLSILKNLLDESTDKGLSSKEAMDAFLKNLAHDFENFLFDYIKDQIDSKNYLYAQELIDNFYIYLKKTIYFDFLKAMTFEEEDITKTNEILNKVIFRLIDNFDLDLAFRVLDYMVDAADRNLFLKLLKLISINITTEEEFSYLMKLSLDFFSRLDNEKNENKILSILNKRNKISPKKEIQKNDKDFLEFLKILS
jgi:hypothetical protein